MGGLTASICNSWLQAPASHCGTCLRGRHHNAAKIIGPGGRVTRTKRGKSGPVSKSGSRSTSRPDSPLSSSEPCRSRHVSEAELDKEVREASELEATAQDLFTEKSAQADRESWQAAQEKVMKEWSSQSDAQFELVEELRANRDPKQVLMFRDDPGEGWQLGLLACFPGDTYESGNLLGKLGIDKRTAVHSEMKLRAPGQFVSMPHKEVRMPTACELEEYELQMQHEQNTEPTSSCCVMM